MTNSATNQIPPTPLYSGDERINTLTQRIQDVCTDASEIMDIRLATILGVLECVKIRLIDQAREQD